MASFRERNPLPLGLLTFVLVAAVLLAVLNINAIVGVFGRAYYAELPEAAGLKQGDPVEISGVDVGRVKSVELGDAGGGVMVEFTIDNNDVTLESETSAAVSIKTVLGDKSLKLTSGGGGRLEDGSTIPLTRTSAPYDVTDALDDLTTETEEIDVDNLAKALDTVSGALDESAPEIRQAFTGVSRLSKTISSRDSELRSLLDHADQFSKILADRNADLIQLVRDGNLLFKVLADRRDDIRALLVNVTAMAKELRGLVRDNKTSLKPTLQQLNRVAATLQKNEDNLDKALRGVAVYGTGLGEVVSSGPFFTAYLQNLLPGNLVPPQIDLEGLELGGLGGLGGIGSSTDSTPPPSGGSPSTGNGGATTGTDQIDELLSGFLLSGLGGAR